MSLKIDASDCTNQPLCSKDLLLSAFTVTCEETKLEFIGFDGIYKLVEESYGKETTSKMCSVYAFQLEMYGMYI